jgi:Family of unknown function (DUF5763)
MQLCSARRKNGDPCTARALADGFCFAHSPALTEKRRAAYAQGGRAKGTAQRAEKLMPEVLRPVLYKLLQQALTLLTIVAPTMVSAPATLRISGVLCFST